MPKKFLNVLRIFRLKSDSEILKYSHHFSDTEYARNSLYTLNIFYCKYSWNFSSIFWVGIFIIIHSVKFLLLSEALKSAEGKA